MYFKPRLSALSSLLLTLSLLSIGIPAGLLAQDAVQATPSSATAGDTTFPGEAWERIENPESAGFSAVGLARLSESAARFNTTGMMVVVGGRVLFEYGNVEELSYLASVRKSVLAMLYGKYVANDSIDLDLTLEEIGFDDVGGLLEVEKQATIRDLISARSGIYHPASNAGDNTDEAPERGSQKPGEYFLYNNWDFNAAGAIFEQESGMNIYDALEQDLAVPIGMQDFDRSAQEKSGDESRSEHMAYHMWLSTRDMARLGLLMLRHGNWNGEQVVPKEWAERICSVVTPNAEMNPESTRKGPFGYGYMWWVWDGEGTPELLKGAYSGMGAFGQFITVIPALDMVVAHKTAVPPFSRSVSMGQYLNLIETLLKAHAAEDVDQE
ncbi:MAG: serine hydrolase [Planctomycetota bacterium]